MSDTPQKSSPRKGTPTEKMIAAAFNASVRHGVKLPANYESDFDVCRDFLEVYLTMPTPKAIAFAQQIALEQGIELPAAVLASGKALSSWIDEHRVQG